MSRSILAALAAALLCGQTFAAHAAYECGVSYEASEDIRDVLLHRAAQALTSSQYVSDNVRITGRSSDDNIFDSLRAGDPVARLREIVQPLAFRQAREPSVVRYSGDPCGIHFVELEAVTTEPNEFWRLKGTFRNGLVESVDAVRFFYTEIAVAEKANG